MVIEPVHIHARLVIYEKVSGWPRVSNKGKRNIRPVDQETQGMDRGIGRRREQER